MAISDSAFEELRDIVVFGLIVTLIFAVFGLLSFEHIYLDSVFRTALLIGVVVTCGYFATARGENVYNLNMSSVLVLLYWLVLAVLSGEGLRAVPFQVSAGIVAASLGLYLISARVNRPRPRRMLRLMSAFLGFLLMAFTLFPLVAVFISHCRGLT